MSKGTVRWVLAVSLAWLCSTAWAGQPVPRLPARQPAAKQPVVVAPAVRLVGRLPDLVVSVAGPAEAVAGSDVDLEVTVGNKGLVPAPGSLEVPYTQAYYVDLVLSVDGAIPVRLAVQPAYAGATVDDFVEDMLLQGGRVSRTRTVAAGGQERYSVRVHLPANAAPGVYYLGGVVDPARAVAEGNETNNTFCYPIVIIAPRPPDVTPPLGVNFWVMPYAVGGTPINEISAAGRVDYLDALSTIMMEDAPFGGRLGLRHGYDGRLPLPALAYYRWLYQADGEAIWHEFTEPVGVHYVREEGGVRTFPIYWLGPKPVAGKSLYEFRPHAPPREGSAVTSWPTTDWFGDIYSGFLTTQTLANGRYRLKLEVYDQRGVQARPEGGAFSFIVPTPPAPDGTIVPRPANMTTEVDNGGFVFPLHVDNRNCGAIVDAPTIGGVAASDTCGFLTYPSRDAQVRLALHATHPANFAWFEFSVVRGVNSVVYASGEVSALTADGLRGDGTGGFSGDFAAGALLSSECDEAAFAENLHVYAKATTGWSQRLNLLDAHAVRAFALSGH